MPPKSSRLKRPQPQGLKQRTVRGFGNIPYEPNQVVITPYEKEMLKGMGWKEGEPIPGQLGKVIEQVRAENQQEMDAAHHDPNLPPLKIPKIRKFQDLPPDKQAEYQEAIAQFRDKVANAAKQPRVPTQNFSPSVRKTFKQFGTADAAIEDIEVVNSDVAGPSEKPGRHPTLQERIRTLHDKAQQKQRKVADESEPDATPEPELMQQAQPSTPDSDLLPKIAHCPNCDYQLSKPYTIELDSGDTSTFLSSILGLRPFTKEYVLFGGKLGLTFRTIPIEATEMAVSQTAYEMRTGKFSGVDEFWGRLWDYRLALGLQRIVLNGEAIPIASIVDEMLNEKDEEGNPTNLPTILKEVQNYPVLASESVWRIAGRRYKHFTEVVGRLEAKADDPDFWDAIES